MSPVQDARLLHLPGGYEAGEALEAAVVGALHVRREAAGGEFSLAEVIAQALAADAVSATARVGASAGSRVARLLAFHGVGVARGRYCVNTDQRRERAWRLPVSGGEVRWGRNGTFREGRVTGWKGPGQAVCLNSVSFPFQIRSKSLSHPLNVRYTSMLLPVAGTRQISGRRAGFNRISLSGGADDRRGAGRRPSSRSWGRRWAERARWRMLDAGCWMLDGEPRPGSLRGGRRNERRLSCRSSWPGPLVPGPSPAGSLGLMFLAWSTP